MKKSLVSVLVLAALMIAGADAAAAIGPAKTDDPPLFGSDVSLQPAT